MSVFICLLSLLTWPIKLEFLYVSCVSCTFATNCYWWTWEEEEESVSSSRTHPAAEALKAAPKSHRICCSFIRCIWLYCCVYEEREGEGRGRLGASLEQYITQGIASLIGSVGQDLYNMYGWQLWSRLGAPCALWSAPCVSEAASDIYVLDLMAILLG